MHSEDKCHRTGDEHVWKSSAVGPTICDTCGNIKTETAKTGLQHESFDAMFQRGDDRMWWVVLTQDIRTEECIGTAGFKTRDEMEAHIKLVAESNSGAAVNFAVFCLRPWQGKTPIDRIGIEVIKIASAGSDWEGREVILRSDVLKVVNREMLRERGE